MDQTRRRVLKEEKLTAEEEIVSIFEPHTAIIKRGKVAKPVEFGRKIFLAESALGLITDYQVLKGNPPDERQVADSLQRHREVFGTAPEVYAADRGFYSEANLELCEKAGIRWCPFHIAGVERLPNDKPWKRPRSFERDNVSGQASKAVSRFYFAAAV